MQVCNRYDDDFVSFKRVEIDYSKREFGNQAAPQIRAEFLIGTRELCDARNGSEHLDTKTLSQPHVFRFVKGYSIIKLGLCQLEKLDLHPWAYVLRMSDNGTVSN